MRSATPARSPVHQRCGGVAGRTRWLERERAKGARIVGVELVDEAIRLAADVVPGR